MPKLSLILLMLCALPCKGYAQVAGANVDIRALIREVCTYQAQMLQRHDSRLRYRVHRVDRKEDSVRELIETRDGVVGRLLQRNGQPLTPELNTGEQERLQDLIGSSRLRRREQDEQKARSYGLDMLQALPGAMIFTLAPQQTPILDAAAKQIVVDFVPDPKFRPASMAQQILTSVAGRLWINEADHHLLRIEMHNTNDVNLAWGILARVYAGGSLTYDQRPFQDLYTYTHIVLHMKIRELMLKTQALDAETTASQFQRLAQSPSGDEAIRTLLALPVPTR